MNSEHKERSVCEIDSYKLNRQNLPKMELYQSQLESCFYVELFDFRLQRAARTLRDSKLRGRLKLYQLLCLYVLSLMCHNTLSIISTLEDMVQYGVGFHHAGMDVADRKAMETMFTNGDVPVLCMYYVVVCT